MNPSELSNLEDRKKEISFAHNEWMSHPVTKQALALINFHEQSVIDVIAAASIQDKEVSDAKIRHFAVQLQTLKTIKSLIFNETKFVLKSTEQ